MWAIFYALLLAGTIATMAHGRNLLLSNPTDNHVRKGKVRELFASSSTTKTEPSMSMGGARATDAFYVDRPDNSIRKAFKWNFQRNQFSVTEAASATKLQAVQNCSSLCAQLCRAVPKGGTECIPECRSKISALSVRKHHFGALHKYFAWQNFCELHFGSTSSAKEATYDGICACPILPRNDVMTFDAFAILDEPKVGQDPSVRSNNMVNNVVLNSVASDAAADALDNGATASTTPDWSELCSSLCKTGDGGSLCNCDISPF